MEAANEAQKAADEAPTVVRHGTRPEAWKAADEAQAVVRHGKQQTRHGKQQMSGAAPVVESLLKQGLFGGLGDWLQVFVKHISVALTGIVADGILHIQSKHSSTHIHPK